MALLAMAPEGSSQGTVTLRQHIEDTQKMLFNSLWIMWAVS